MNPRVIPSTQARITFAIAFAMIAITSAIVQRIIPIMMTGIALRIS
jgi:hypothetical protein